MFVARSYTVTLVSPLKLVPGSGVSNCGPLAWMLQRIWVFDDEVHSPRLDVLYTKWPVEQ
jgi:hypothetical protein